MANFEVFFYLDNIIKQKPLISEEYIIQVLCVWEPFQCGGQAILAPLQICCSTSLHFEFKTQ